MRASVIIPAYNAETTLARCLVALAVQTLPPQDFEVIVVDDGSTDATAQLVASFDRARCISFPRAGAAAARNRGAHAAQGPILLFTDADCAPLPDWMDKMLAVFADPQVVGAKGRYLTQQRQPIARFVQIEYEEKYARLRRAQTIDFVDTYSAAYRRSVFLENHGFDESFPTASAEDREFSFRLARQGYKMVFVSDAIVFHEHTATLGSYLRRKFWNGYWNVRVHARHPKKLWKDSHTPQTQKLQTILFLGILIMLLAVPFSSLARLAVLGAIALFVLSALPLLALVLRRDAAIGWVAPAMIVLRSGALGLGLAAGAVGEFVLRWKTVPSNSGNDSRRAP